jgi:hypothetical protein
MHLRMDDAFETVEVIERYGSSQLTHSIRTEVEENHGIAIPDRSDRVPIAIDEDDRLHEFIGCAGLVRSSNGIGG